MAEPTIPVEVAFALPQEQVVVPLAVPIGTTAREALRRSGLPRRFPAIQESACALGVYGRVVGEAYVLRPGDRVEVYRPLEQDPREARRQVAAGPVSRR